MSQSKLSIGPIDFTHEVQEISIQEVKAVDTLQATRTNKNFISETGQGNHRAVIRLLITGIDEINGNLRKLVALFKCCPIISVYNELLSKSWNPDLSPIRLNDQQVDTREATRTRTLYVPVALEDLAISSVPDLPFSLYVTLSVSRVDVSSVYADNILLYSDEDGNPTPYPEKAFYLKKWIDILLKTQKIPLLYGSDFAEVSLEWNGEYITGETIPPPSADTSWGKLRFNQWSHAKIQSEQCSIKNLFAYNVLQGKGYPFPQHMGSTSMYYSMDILFTDQTDDKEYNIFCSFKESSDYIARAKERLTRVAGWELNSPVVKMLSAFPGSTGRGNVRPRSAVFVPLNVTIDTANLPPLNKAVRVDLAETNFEVFSNSETLLVQGGSDYSGLKAYFDSIVKNDYEFRSTIRSDPQKVAKAITGQDTSINASKLFDDHTTFWPIINGYFKFSTNETFGLLNKDTLLAVFLDTKFDEQEKLRIALQANITIAGRVATGIKLPNIFYRTDVNYQELRNSFFGADPESQSFKKVFEIIYDYVQNKMFYGTFSVELEKFYALIASRIFTAFFGGYEGALSFTNSGGEAVQLLSQSGYQFNKPFTDALFNVIAKRSGPPQEISRAYSVDGLMAAYLKLAIKYAGDSSSSPDLDTDPNKDVSTAINKFFRRSVYEDLILPKYVELYDSRWKEFAPTYSDVGIINSMPGKSTLTSNDAQNYIVVEENDTVSPSAWFYNKKYKQDLLAQVTDNAKDVTGLGNKFHLSIPFSTEDLDSMERELAKEKALQANNPSFKSETLAQTIRTALAKAQINSLDDYNKGINELSIAAAERYYDQYMADGTAVFSLYVHHNGNIQTRKRLSAPGLAKAVLTVAQDFKLLRPSARLPQPVTDAGYKSADRTNEFEWIRSLDTNTKNTIESDINQIPDIYESSAKMFPAMKVYLLEKRGTDLYGDDSFFSVNPIISIDITMDKDDADLAVIRIADPLFILQRAFFPSSNVITVDGENGSTDIKQILGSLKGNNLGGYLKRYKIIEGRPIQIRMGYEAMPFNLKTVFTGRIVEIQPGDVLTIVCQSWKAELINRQVTFYNDNTQNWGVRDLVIQAIQNSNPDGYGDFFPQLTSDFIQKNLQGIDIQEFLSTILQRQEGVDTESGTRSVGGQITNYVYETLSLQSRAEDNKGIDTRLKNVWWPDLPSPNNFLGWRQFSGILPSQANDGWIIPLQTTWDVLKEGTRHSWNSIVQVVPFDGEATLFFGHPDQPYYFTKGGPNSRQKWKKYIGSKTKFVQDSVRLIKGFLTSREYTNNIPKAFSIKTLTGSIDALFLTPQSKLSQPTSRLSPSDISLFTPTDIELFGDTDSVFWKLQRLDTQLVDQVSNFVDIQFFDRIKSKFTAGYKGLEYILDKSNVLQEVIDRSYLPERALESIRGRLGNRTIPILLKLFWGIQEDQLYKFWASAETDVPLLLKSSNERGSSRPDTILNKLVGVPTISSDKFSEGLKQILQTEYEELQQLKLLSAFNLNFNYVNGRYAGIATSSLREKRPVSQSVKDYYYLNYSQISDDTKEYAKKVLDSVVELERYLATKPIEERSFGRQVRESYIKLTSDDEVNFIKNSLEKLYLASDSTVSSYSTASKSATSIKNGINSIEDIKNNLANFKAFVYYFDQYLKNNPETEQITKDLTSGDLSLVPPNMQVFRQHHWIDTDHDIINNHIVASTKDMWNTVVVEYPAHAEASAKLDDLEVESGDIYNQGEFYSGLKWVYYPSNEVSGVVGLQFHPGLTLANKKIKIFTELNCQSEELACKLACTHLADGIRRMYRGTLAVTGRIIKPHDRIILNDEYLEMTGPLEVESVVHHWSIETGWVSNIAPQAVCDANPGAAVLQTAALEDAFNKVFKLLDYASEALVIASILATVLTAGAAAPAAMGAFSLRSTILTGLKGLLNKGRTKFVADVVKGNVASVVRAGRFTIKAKGSPKLIIRKLWRDYGGLGKSVFGNYLFLETSKQITHSAFRIAVTSSFVENAQKVEQLPVILSPLIFNGLPFLAGMETDDPVWSVHFNDVFWSLRDFNRAGEQFLQSLGVEAYADLQSELKKI